MQHRLDRPTAPMLVGLALGLSAIGSASAAAELSVGFIHPETYTDAAYTHRLASDQDRADVERDIVQHLQRLADRGLPAAESLKIDVLDIDLAGRFEPLRVRTANEVRIVRDIARPSMTLRYTLSQGERVIESREERLADLNFMTPANRYPSGDPLRYEKAMLDRWFEQRFVRP